MKDIKTDILWRVVLVYSVIVLMGMAIIAKIIHIQIYEGPQLLEVAKEQHLRYFDVEAVRGTIFASDGSLLATSVPVFEIRLDLASPLIGDRFFNENVGALARELGKLFGDKPGWKYETELRNERRKGNRYFKLRSKATYDQLKALRTFPILERGMYRGGLIAISRTERVKPYALLAQRTIGYENRNEEIFVGLEGAYSDVLTGKDGKQLKKRINNGDWRPVYDENEVEPENGKDIITSIDVNLQDVAEDALNRHLKEHRADWGCAVLMEVGTGFIKAIANLKYDEKSDRYHESYNFAVGASIEPGSTFKLASVLALLEDGRAALDDSVEVGYGVARYYNLEIKDVHAPERKWMKIREAFEVSSNVGISKAVFNAYSGDPGAFISRMHDFSLSEPLEIEIPGEGMPFVKNTDHASWSKVSLPFMSIGYELKLTPLHLLSLYNAIANDGVMVKPLFVREIREAGKTIDVREPEVINRSVCSDETLHNVRSLLEGVVERGTARSLCKSVYRIAGKTGTAQIANDNLGYDKQNYNASFVGYFPADNPKYSCIVVVSRPSTGKYYASSVAVPVFREIADKVYSTRPDIHHHMADTTVKTDYPLWTIGHKDDLEYLYNEFLIPLDPASANSEWAVSMSADSAVKLQPRLVGEGIVPNVKGMGIKDALFILENLGLKVEIKGRGLIREQSLPPGKSISKGETITLKMEV